MDDPGIKLSLLQTKMLAALSAAQQPTVTALANTVQSSRPSVSRSLQSLDKAKLVKRVGRAVSLTARGRMASGAAADALIGKRRRLEAALTGYRNALDAVRPISVPTKELLQITRSVEEAARPGRALVQAMEELRKPSKEMLRISHMMEEATRPGRELLRTVRLMEELRKPSEELLRVARLMENAAMPGRALVQAMEESVHREALRSLGAMNDSMSLLAGQFEAASRTAGARGILSDWAHTLQANNVALSATAHLATSMELRNSLLSGWAANSLGWVTSSYRHYLRGLRPATDPGKVVAASVATARYAVVADRLGTGSPTAPLTAGMLAPETAVSARLDVQLSQMDQKLVQARRGAWAAIHSENPDKVRQAAHSMRELLRHVLSLLAPDQAFSERQIREEGHEGSVTRRMRIRFIARGSRGKFATVLDAAINETYGILSMDAHTGDDDLEVLEAIMAATEGHLAFLLAVSRYTT